MTTELPQDAIVQVLVKVPRTAPIALESKVGEVTIAGITDHAYTVTAVEIAPYDLALVHLTLAPTRDADEETP